MQLYYTDHFELPLPPTHRFPMDKYRRLRRHVATSDAHRSDVLLVPPAATDEQLLRCHHGNYIDRVATGTLSAQEIRRIGFPWSPKMVQRSRRSTGATIAASRSALVDGIAANLAGGTHHAFSDAGEGYCVFNDAAVAIRTLQAESRIGRGCVIDLDVHQGNGTASILAGDPSAVTMSMHGAKNFPLRKVPSDLDVPLDDGTDDDTYLEKLSLALTTLDRWRTDGEFDLVVYLAGADPYVGDRLGRMCLSKSGLIERDRTVIQWCVDRSIPVAIAMSGGYAADIDEIVAIHAATLKIAGEMSRQMG
ncbi:Histone deacetylase-like amidohydrolase [Stieleria maiorica]|uniref:Histone deacetylase-like amidohydrolase n=1 Tax=Stieleria maiorica TaxID=2795974 RepID=A0A5B9M6R3_9BACT|nr:histone deacetylase [Stieleria maiorica]QEF96881.1 Histone deacetylase-like amidohydrolase [Stieleria maiorica]